MFIRLASEDGRVELVERVSSGPAWLFSEDVPANARRRGSGAMSRGAPRGDKAGFALPSVLA